MKNKQKSREEMKKEILKFEEFLLEHLEEDTDDFSGYHTKKGINEDSFHIGFENLIKSVDQALSQREAEVVEEIKKFNIDCSFGKTPKNYDHLDQAGAVDMFLENKLKSLTQTQSRYKQTP